VKFIGENLEKLEVEVTVALRNVFGSEVVMKKHEE